MIRQGADPTGWIAAAMLVLLPLPFGGITPWSAAAAQIAAFLLFLTAVATAPRLSPLARVAPTALALSALAVLGLLQSLPLPAGLVSILSPAHGRLYRQAAELAGREELAASLSLAPQVSRATALLLLAAAAGMAGAALAGQRRRPRRLCGLALLTAAVGQLIVGLPAWIDDRTTLWGIEVPIASGRLHGTFVNPNHFAHYLGIVLPCLFAWLWWGTRRATQEQKTERRLLWIVPPSALWLLLLGAMSLSASRGALLAALLALAVQVMLLAAHYRRWGLALGGLGVGAAGLAAAAWLGFGRGLARLVGTNPFDVSLGFRFDAWSATLQLWRRFPVFGSGLGTFRDGFPLVQPPTLGREWWHAHNGYLELLATAGVVGVLLAGWGVWALVRRLWRNFRFGERSEDRAAALAALGVLVACAVHEALDFGLTMPANALTLALVCGLAAGVPTGSTTGEPRRG
jgi:O-antigen ligase